MSPEIKQIIAAAESDLTAFVVNLATLPIDHLAHQLLVAIELEGEEEDHVRAHAYRRQANVIEAIGKFRFGIAFDDAMEKEAGGA